MNRTALVAWWQGLAARERRVLGGGAAVLAAVLVWLLLWEPPAQGIRKLQADLPQLVAQDASLRAMAAEAVTLRAAKGNTTALAPADRVAAVRRSLQRAGLWREGDVAGAKGPDGTTSTTVSTLTVSGTVTTVSTAASTRSDPPEITSDSTDRVRVRFEDIDYGVWVAWLATTEGELSTRAARASVLALAPKGPVGHVRAEVVLDWSQPAPSGAPARS